MSFHTRSALLLQAAAITAVVALSPYILAKDIPGSKDHPMVKLDDGSEIAAYGHKSYAALRLALEPVVFNYNDEKFDPYQKADVEGRKTTIYYTMPTGLGPLEAIRNYDNELREKGFEILFSASGDGLEGNKGESIPSDVHGVTAATPSKHKIGRKRLFPVGVSFASPVATNSTDEGRAKNRRLELMEMPEPK